MVRKTSTQSLKYTYISIFSSIGFAIGLGLIILFIDFITKYFIHRFLSPMEYSFAYPYGGIAVFRNFLGIEFSITHATNHGAAWGTFAEWQQPLLYLRIALVFGIIGYMLFFNKQRAYLAPLVCITAGAIGNILDYFLYGHVIDMIHFVFWGYDYPVFNIADSAIFLGLAWLFLTEIIQKKRSKETS